MIEEKHGTIAIQKDGKRTFHHHCLCHKSDPEKVPEFTASHVVEKVVHINPAPIIVNKLFLPKSKKEDCFWCNIKKWFKRS